MFRSNYSIGDAISYYICVWCFRFIVLAAIMHSAHLAPATSTTFLPLTLWRDKPTTAVAINEGDTRDEAAEKFGYIEYKPNGTLILRSTFENGTNMQELLLFKTVLSAIKLTANHRLTTTGNIKPVNAHLKLYGEGVEHKFPPFLERILQRIQTYFSIYKYTDTSQPLAHAATLTAAASATEIDEVQSQGSDGTLTGVAIDADIGGGGGILQTTTNILDLNAQPAYTEFITIGEEQQSNAMPADSATTVSHYYTRKD